MSKRCKRIKYALVVMTFTVLLCAVGCDECFSAPRTGAGQGKKEQTAAQKVTGSTQTAEQPTRETDLTDSFSVILQGATKELIAGYAVDESFLMWLDARFGDETVTELADCVREGRMEPEVWYEKTGNSIHVLWLMYCRDSGFQKYRLDNVYWKEQADSSQIVLGFAGDFNFADGWCTTEYLKRQAGGIYDCFSEELLKEMQEADVMVMNNEFTYAEEGTVEPLPGKAYTFRADPMMVPLLEAFGTDAVTLANNHVYDYGEEGLLDTVRYLNEAGVPYLGAGENIDEASKILYYVVGGRKIAIVSATQIERVTKYTKEATETEPGVLKTLDPERFLQMIRQADASSDYVIAVVHWGTEGSLTPEHSQRLLAQKYADAGADAIIGGHPHRLQGAAYVDGVPVAYSLGNFWFSDGTLYTTLAKVIIGEDGSVTLRYVPCEQRRLVTRILTGQEETDGFYHYLAAISTDVGIDAQGNVYDKMAADYPADRIVYDSSTSKTKIRGTVDNEGNAIDIVGNRK